MMLDHVDFEAAVWVKPADAMKTGKAYRVPVSDQALEVLRAVRTDVRGAGQVFPGSRLPVELQGLGGATRTSSRFSQAR